METPSLEPREADIVPGTAFGAPWGSAASACAVLRAQASRDVAMAPVSVTEQVACVVAAHIWSNVTGQTSLRSAATQTPAALCAAAAILATAAGQGSAVEDVDIAIAQFEDMAESAGPGGHRRAERSISEALVWTRRTLATYTDREVAHVLVHAARLLTAQQRVHGPAQWPPTAMSGPDLGLVHAASMLVAEAESLL